MAKSGFNNKEENLIGSGEEYYKDEDYNDNDDDDDDDEDEDR